MSEEENFKRISAKDFLKIDYSKVILIDLREPDELIIDSIPNAINIPFSRFATDLDKVPKDKPVYVYCSHGDFSEQISEILADRGYDVTNVDGGFRAIQAARKDSQADTSSEATKTAMPKVVEIDAKGLKCPGPIVKVGDTLRAETDGTRFHVQATEDAFCSDIKIWCERTGNTLDSLETKDGIIDVWLTKTQDSKKSGTEGEGSTGCRYSSWQELCRIR